MKIEFFRHELGKEELDSVAEVLAGPILTTGEVVERFERRFAEYLGCRHAVGLTSCTAAMHLSLLALGIGPGDEVITTPMTFIATPAAILMAGAKPVFVDVETDTGNLDATKIESAITDRTRAILPVHLYGQMCDMRTIRNLADCHRLYVVEDAAHCIEGARDGIRPGQLGDTACFSFYATKSLTCGEGGAVATNSDELASRIRLLRLHGMTKTAADRHKEGYAHWDMIMLGWKYNMDNIQAALLLPQLGRIDNNLKRRTALARYYEEKLSDIRGVSGPKTLPNTDHAHHLFPIWVDTAARDMVVEGLQKQGISVVVNYRAIHLLTYFREFLGYRLGDYPVSEHIGNSTISLPLYTKMPLTYADRVIDSLKSIVTTSD